MQPIPEEIVDAIESIHLPSMPQALLRFLQATEDDRSSVADLAALISQNPALSARIMTIANSVAMRRDREVKTIEHCLITLGTCLVRTLAACLAIQSVFARAAGDPLYDYTGFWGHSLRVAEMSRAIAERMEYPEVEEAYLAGLLHDIGQLLLLGGVGERYGALLVCSVDEAALRAIEQPVLGADHAAVGAWLVDQWELSSFMADAILFHHSPPDQIRGADRLSQIVWSAHAISSVPEISTLSDEQQPAELSEAEALLGISLGEVQGVYQASAERVNLLATAFGIAELSDTRTLPYSSIAFESLDTRVSESDEAYGQLESAVRDIALMQSLQQNLANQASETEMLLAVRESARILFGLKRLAFLLVNPEKPVLAGVNMQGQPTVLQRLEIRLEPGQSLAASVTLGRNPCCTFDEDCPAYGSLIDIQITRALGGQGVLYVPLYGREGAIGLMACGLSPSQYDRLRPTVVGMASFAHLAAVSIESWRSIRQRELQLKSALTDHFEQQARRIVHEAGNPLSIIKNYLKIVSQKQPGDSNIQQELDILREEIDRVVTIVQRLSDRSTYAGPEAECIDLNVLIEGMLVLYAESLFKDCHITVEKHLSAGLSLAKADRDTVKQVLLNLWKNASEAMAEEGGHFSITTRDNVVLKGGLYIEIGMSDSGPGLPEDVMRRLFQPLERDRRPGHSGLGLSIVADLVERLGGQITCQSDAGAGTSFRILLPRAGTERARN